MNFIKLTANTRETEAGKKITRATSLPTAVLIHVRINYYVELLIDFNGNKFAARETVNSGGGWRGKFNDRILTLNGRAARKKGTGRRGRALKLCSGCI